MGGGSADFTFEVGPEERAEINLTGNRVSSAGDSSCSDDESGLSLEVGAVVPSEGGAARGFCIESGAEAEGYTIVVTNPSLDVTQRLNLTLTASGIRVGQPTATVAARPGVGSSRRLGKERRGRGAARRGQEESGRVGRTGARGRTTS